MLTTVLGTVHAVNGTTKVKVTWNGNGGKIGTSKTTVTLHKKGTHIGKLPKTPKKIGYAFNGWYTEKSGGTKITTLTKINKKATHYAHWKKSTNAVIDSRLIGTWKKVTIFTPALCTFTDKGIFVYNNAGGSYANSGNYRVSGGKIFLTHVITHYGSGLEIKYPDTVLEYKFVKDSHGNDCLHMPIIDYPNKNYLDSDLYAHWTKSS